MFDPSWLGGWPLRQQERWEGQPGAGVRARSGFCGCLKAKWWWRREEAGRVDWDQIAKGLEFETERCAFNSLENGEMVRDYFWRF